MPPAEPAPDFSGGLLSNSPPKIEEKNEYEDWKKIADELKLAGYPMNLASNQGVDHFSAELRRKARLLDMNIESLIMQMQIPEKAEEALMELRKAVCQGLSKEKFEKLMTDHNFSVKCNVIWESDAIAYRCNTCSKTPCMSLCATCYAGGDHTGHDVTRFFSREGGACDCGNEDVLKMSGFCSKHGENAVRPPPPPEEIVSLAELILLRVLMVILDHFRRYRESHMKERVPSYMRMTARPVDQHGVDQVCGAGKLIAFLQECMDYGGPIRDVLGKILIDKEIYKGMWAVPEEDVHDKLSQQSFRVFREKQKIFEKISADETKHYMLEHFFPDFEKEMMTADCFLHEVLFWMRLHLFPQSLINLTLVFLGDAEYRDAFARRFFLLYPWTADSMKDACEGMSDFRAISAASSRIIHISVQMLSSGALCSRLTDEINLPRLMFGSVAFLLTMSIHRATPIKLLKRKDEGPIIAALSAPQPPVGNVGPAAMIDALVAAAAAREAAAAGQPPPVVAPGEAPRLPGLMPGDLGGRVPEQEDLDRILQEEPWRNPVHDRLVQNLEGAAAEWYTLDEDRSAVIQNHGYWFAMGDTQNLLSHPEVVSKMCKDEKTMELYFMVIEKMHCMDTIQRIYTGDHLAHDRQEEYQRTLILEYEMSASSMFNMVFGLVSNGDEEAAAAYYDAIWKSLMNWVGGMDLPNAGRPLALSRSVVSFHLPLLRHFATLVAYTHSYPAIQSRLDLLSKRETREMMMAMMLHPLRIMAARTEWCAGMWVRNGQQMRIPVCLYSQTHMLFSYNFPDLDFLRLCASLICPCDFLHALFNAFSFGDVFKWMRKSDDGSLISPIYGVTYDPEKALNLTRREWVDTMVFGCMRLIADIVVLFGVGEQSDEEALRDDIVCKLAISDMPHSRLRQSMAEKGSHGSELIDIFFEKILEEVANFSDPEQNENLEHGVYSLSQKAQIDFLCPLQLMMRTTNMRSAASVLQRVETDERRWADRPEHKEKNVWIPYRLPDLDESASRRMKYARRVYRLLKSERILETACYVLEQYAKDWEVFEAHLSSKCASATSHEFLFKEQTIQIVIYLLSLAVLYKRLEPDGAEIRSRFHTDLSNEQSPNRSLASTLLSLGPILMCMNMKRGEMSKEEEERRVRQMMRDAVKGEIKSRLIAGTPAEYYGRLLALLYRDDAPFRVMLNERYPAVVEEKMEVEEEKGPAVDVTPNTLIAKKRAAAEALRRKIMEEKKKRSGETMRKLMEEEKMTQEDLDRLDVSDKAVEQYECPICGDETPASFDNPIGLLVFMQFSAASMNSLDATEEELTLLEVDERAVERGEAQFLRSHRHEHFWKAKASEVDAMMCGEECDMVGTPSWYELKTCGHHVHVSCLSQYKDTIASQARARNHRSSELVLCPKCRFITNGLLPLRVRTGVEVNEGERLRASTPAAGRMAVYDTIVKQLQVTHGAVMQLSDEEAVATVQNTHMYSFRTLRHLIEMFHNLSTRRDTNDIDEYLRTNSHTFLQGLLIQNVNRNLFFEGVGAAPLRPKCMDLVSEHINFHSTLLFARDEIEITIAHARELLMEEPMEYYDSELASALEQQQVRAWDEGKEWRGGAEEEEEGEKKDEEREEEADPMEGPSGVGREEREEKKKKEEKSVEEREVEQVVAEIFEVLLSTGEVREREKTLPDPYLTMAMKSALSSPALSQSAQWKKFQPVCSRRVQRVRFSEEWRRRCGKKQANDHDARLPVTFSRPLTLAARMTSVVMNSEMNRESMLESLYIVMRRVVAVAATRFQLWQLCRTDYATVREYALEEREGEAEEEGRVDRRIESLHGFRRVMARVLVSHPPFTVITKSLEKRELPSFAQYMEEPLRELLMKVAQLWHEIRLKPLPEGRRTALGMSREELEKHVMGPSGLCEFPTEFVVAQWAINTVHPLAFICAKSMLFLEEPLSYKPFVTLKLPLHYDDIFQRYFGRACHRCGKNPQHPLICLICGGMICLDDCCSTGTGNVIGERKTMEVEMHPCSVHQAYLALNSALIVFVKQRVEGIYPSCRALIWGSVYLDAHGEEDRNLRRGKPLKLAAKRVERMHRDLLEGDLEPRGPYQTISQLATHLTEAHFYRP